MNSRFIRCLSGLVGLFFCSIASATDYEATITDTAFDAGTLEGGSYYIWYGGYISPTDGAFSSGIQLF